MNGTIVFSEILLTRYNLQGIETVLGLLGFPLMVFFRKDNLSDKDHKSLTVAMCSGETSSLRICKTCLFLCSIWVKCVIFLSSS